MFYSQYIRQGNKKKNHKNKQKHTKPNNVVWDPHKNIVSEQFNVTFYH